MAYLRRLDHFLGGHPPPINVVSSLQTEFAKEFALRPTISFPKGMCSVQFAEKVGGAVSKGVDSETDEMVFSRKLQQ